MKLHVFINAVSCLLILFVSSVNGNDVIWSVNENHGRSQEAIHPVEKRAARKNVRKVRLMYNSLYQRFLKQTVSILTSEAKRVTIPANTKTDSQFVKSVVENTNLVHTLKRILSQEDIRNFLPKPEAVNQTCYDNVVDMFDGMIGIRKDASAQDFVTPEWAFQIMDAFGKPTPGLHRGSLQWVGSYDQCLDIRPKIANRTFLGSRPTPRNATEFQTQYCRVQIVLPGLVNLSAVEKKTGYWIKQLARPALLHWGMCLPKSCSENDVKDLLMEGTLSTAGLNVQNALCFAEDPDLGSDEGAVFAVCLFSLVGAFIVGCTVVESAMAYDLISVFLNQNESREDVEIASTETFQKCSVDSAIDNDRLVKNRNHEHGWLSNGNGVMKPDHRTPLKTDTKPKDLLRDEDTSSHHQKQLVTGKNAGKSGFGMKVVEAFSLRYNFVKLLATTSSQSTPGNLASIQGIRVISICWIVLGHTYTIGGAFDGRNLMFSVVSKIRNRVSSTHFTFIAAANLGVDTFFVISGLLVMMMTLRELRKGKGQGIGFWIMFCLHRIWRLTPVYMMVLMTGTTLYDFIVEGPLKSDPYLMFEHCPSRWWTNLLYINNMVDPDKKSCMPWSWYLAVDMQLFMMSPFFIILVYRKYRAGIAALISTIALGTIGTFLAALKYSGQMLTVQAGDLDYWKHVYVAPWTRIAGFTIGMLTGIILEDMGDKPTLSKLKAFLIWLFLSGMSLFIIMIPHDQWKDEGDLWPRGTLALYETSSRLVWSIFVAWVIYACQTGVGGVANEILSWPAFQPLARLTYTTYLVHPLVTTFFMYDRNYPVDLEDSVMLFRFWGNLMMSFLFALVYTLVFESPLMALEKILLKRT